MSLQIQAVYIKTSKINCSIFFYQFYNVKRAVCLFCDIICRDLSHNEFTGALPTLVSPNQTKILEL